MARIRTIKPEFFHNEDVAELSFQSRLLFIGLWTVADRRGRLEDRPKRIKALLFPYDNIEVNDHLDELRSAGFITRYETVSDEGACNVIQIKNFESHQRITGREADVESIYPPPPSGNNGETTGKQQGSNGETTGVYPVAQERERSIGKGKGKEGTSSARSSEAPAPDVPPPEIFITLPLNSGAEFPITRKHIDDWSTLYPAIDVEQSLRAMRGWCDANPKRRKTKSGILKFINAWLSHDQNDPRKHRDRHDNHPPSSSRGNTGTGRHIPLDEVAERERRFRERHGIAADDEAGAGALVLAAQGQSGNGLGDHVDR